MGRNTAMKCASKAKVSQGNWQKSPPMTTIDRVTRQLYVDKILPASPPKIAAKRDVKKPPIPVKKARHCQNSYE